jgi:hypothetical protein
MSVDDTLKKITAFINDGNVRIREYEEAQVAAGFPAHQMPANYDQRRLAKKTLLDAVAERYPVVLSYLQSFCDKSGKNMCVPLGLAAELGTMNFLQAFCTLKVVMDCMEPLQRRFQSPDLNVLEIQPLVNQLIEALKEALKRDLPVLCLEDLFEAGKGKIKHKNFTDIQKAATRTFAEKYITTTITHLQTRFPSLGLLKTLSKLFDSNILKMRMKMKNSDYLTTYGEKEYKEMCEMFLPFKEGSIEYSQMLEDWLFFKKDIKAMFSKYGNNNLNTVNGVCSYILQNISFNSVYCHCDSLILLAHLVLVIPSNTASVERV